MGCNFSHILYAGTDVAWGGAADGGNEKNTHRCQQKTVLGQSRMRLLFQEGASLSSTLLI